MARGISEIIAVLMMIVIVSSASIIIYSYSVGFFTGVTSVFGERISMDIVGMREKFVIVDVFVKVLSNGSIVSAAVYNYGKTDITLHQMFINGTRVNVEEINLLPNSVTWFNGSVSISLSNSTFYLRIVSKMGNFHEVLVS